MRGLVSIAIVLTAFCSHAAGRPKMAIPAPRAEHGVDQGSANLLSELLTTDIQRSGKYDVMNAADIASMIGLERQKQMAGCSEEGCLAELGNALGADLMLDTSVGTIGNLRVLALKLIDVKTGAVKGRESDTVADDAALVEAGHRLLGKLLGITVETGAPKTGRRMAGIGVLAGGGALTVAGIVLGASAQSTVNQYRTSPANGDLGNSAVNTAHFADAMFGTAIVCAGVATYLLVSSRGGP